MNQDNFPAFYFRDSGFPSPLVYPSHTQFANLVSSSSKLGLRNGMVFAMPVPESAELNHRFQSDIREAILDADRKGIKGKLITPYLLQKLNEVTRGETLKTNIALVLNNAKHGCKIALELERIEKRPLVLNGSISANRPLIIGATVNDITSRTASVALLNTSTPGTIVKSLGGVGRNIAEACHRTGGNPLFMSFSDKDTIREISKLGMDTSHIIEANGSASYNAIHDSDGELICAVAGLILVLIYRYED
jgi:pseudouridine-5'-phosphate glycosidase/pseudouridine kinase